MLHTDSSHGLLVSLEEYMNNLSAVTIFCLNGNNNQQMILSIFFFTFSKAIGFLKK